MERLTDRESGVRVQAIVALARLQSDEEGTDQQTLRLLLHRLRHDASAEVRRAALFNITPTTATLPYLLERLQDVDTTNRRCVYLGSLKMLVDAQPLLARDDGASVRASLGLGEVSLSEVIRVGLHERDASVQKAARKLVAYWLEAMGGDILTLLEHLHVSRTENGEPVVLALLEESQEVRTTVQALLEDHMSYWAAMTPAKALLARCFVLYSTTHHMERALESCIPVVTALVFRIQAEYEALSQSLEQQAMEEAEEDDGDGLPMVQDDLALSRVFTVNEMLTLAMYCDYGDEMGRRKMYMLVREMLGNAWLPSKLVPRCLDVLLRLSSGQRDFLQLVVELVQSLEADIDEDMAPMANEGEDGVAIADTSTTRQALSWHQRVVDDASPAQAAHMAELEARRLLIVRSMLERLSCSLQGDATLEGLIQELIVPTVQSKDAVLREQGLVCLGLCSLLDPKTALVTFPLLLSQIQRAQGTIRVRCVECLFDLTVMHGIDMLCAQSAEVAAQNEFNGDEEQGLQYARQQMIGFLLSLLEHDDPKVQATASEGISKLLLTGVLFDDDVLKSLVLTYMSPDTADNQALRQCLSYFLPLFCSSDVRHQHMIQRVFVDVLDVLSSVYEDPDAQLHMVTPTQIVLQLLDWTNPERLLYVSWTLTHRLSQPDDMIHIDMAIDALRHGLTSTRRDERKAIVAMLSKLTWPTTIDTSRATQLALLADALQLVRLLTLTRSGPTMPRRAMPLRALSVHYKSMHRLSAMRPQQRTFVHGSRRYRLHHLLWSCRRMREHLPMPPRPTAVL